MGSFAPLLSSGVGTRPHFGELKWTCLTLAHLRQLYKTQLLVKVSGDALYIMS